VGGAVPVTLPARALGDALARLQEHDVDAEPALSWLGWDGEGPLRLRRYDLLVYLWYALRAEPVGIVAWRERCLAAAGRAALHHGLRPRALGPVRSIP
jgi:hypothetical protein